MPIAILERPSSRTGRTCAPNQSWISFEEEATAQRFAEPLPSGKFDGGHLRAIHCHLFQDVYTWPRALRTVRISKGKFLLLP